MDQWSMDPESEKAQLGIKTEQHIADGSSVFAIELAGFVVDRGHIKTREGFHFRLSSCSDSFKKG